MSHDRETITPGADVHDHVWPSLLGGANSLACVERETPFPHLIEARVPQDDLGGRVRRNDDVEYESLSVESPRRGQRPVTGFEGRARSRQSGSRSRGDP